MRKRVINQLFVLFAGFKLKRLFPYLFFCIRIVFHSCLFLNTLAFCFVDTSRWLPLSLHLAPELLLKMSKENRQRLDCSDLVIPMAAHFMFAYANCFVGSAGIAELLIFHPVGLRSTHSIRSINSAILGRYYRETSDEQSNKSTCGIDQLLLAANSTDHANPQITSVSGFNSVVFKEYASAPVFRKFTSLFPGLGYAAGYKVGVILFWVMCRSVALILP